MTKNSGLEDCGAQATRSAQSDELSSKLQSACRELAVGAVAAAGTVADAAAIASGDLETKGILPFFKIDDINKYESANYLTDQKGATDLVLGLLRNNPDMVAKAAESLPDGSYPIGQWISMAEKTGLIKVDPKDAELVNGLQVLTKNGDHFDVTLKNPLVEQTGQSGEVDLARHISFDLVPGDNPTINHIRGISHPVAPLVSVDLDAVRATKNSQGGYDYQVHTPGVGLGPFHLGADWKPL